MLTKMYVGKYTETYYPENEKHCVVITDMGIFYVNDTTFIVPQQASCYIRRETGGYDMHPDVKWRLEHQFFTWYGAKEEYKLYRNIDFRILR